MTFKEWCISQKDKVKQQFRQLMGYELNLNDPKTISEKLNWLKIYDSTFLKTLCSDKLKVREYVKDKIGKDLFLPVLGVYDKFEQIDFSKLPKNYVIKCNHGSGMNIIVKDGKIDKTDAKRKIDKWMQTDYLHLLEFSYKPIQKKIFVEQYMENVGKTDLTDYKLYCFNGKPKFCQIITNRHSNEKISHYDLNWNYSPIYDQQQYDSDSKLERPSNYENMINYATVLSKDFKFVRIDFYEINNEVYLSELTFYSNGGYLKYKNKDTGIKIGNLLEL